MLWDRDGTLVRVHHAIHLITRDLEGREVSHSVAEISNLRPIDRLSPRPDPARSMADRTSPLALGPVRPNCRRQALSHLYGHGASPFLSGRLAAAQRKRIVLNAESFRVTLNSQETFTWDISV